MITLKVLICLAVLTLIEAQLLNPKNYVQTTMGKRVDGDRFLLIAHKLSPFFNEPSEFRTTFEVFGNFTQIEITSFGVPNESGSSFAIGNDYYISKIIHRNIIVSQTIMKVYGYEKPIVVQSTP